MNRRRSKHSYYRNVMSRPHRQPLVRFDPGARQLKCRNGSPTVGCKPMMLGSYFLYSSKNDASTSYVCRGRSPSSSLSSMLASFSPSTSSMGGAQSTRPRDPGVLTGRFDHRDPTGTSGGEAGRPGTARRTRRWAEPCPGSGSLAVSSPHSLSDENSRWKVQNVRGDSYAGPHNRLQNSRL